MTKYDLRTEIKRLHKEHSNGFDIFQIILDEFNKCSDAYNGAKGMKKERYEFYYNWIKEEAEKVNK